MRLSKITRTALTLGATLLGLAGMAAYNTSPHVASVSGVAPWSASAADCPAGYCQPIGAYPSCAAPGTCVDMPWGSLRCLSGGNWEGFPYRDCRY
jgi:hypothetical protein